MWKTILKWLKTFLKQFDYDNDLFEKGMNEVAKQLKALLKKYPIAQNEVLDKIKGFMYDKFGKIKPLKKLIGKAITRVAVNSVDNKIKTINGLIDKYKRDIIKYYNDNF